MNDQFTLRAALEGRNDTGLAFREAIGDAREYGRELDRLDGRTIRTIADLEDRASADLKELDRLADRLDSRSLEIDARLSDRASGDINRLDRLVDRLDGRDINMRVDVDTGGAVTQLAAFEGAAAGAEIATEGFVGSTIRTARFIGSAGFLGIVAAASAAVYGLGAGFSAAGGGAVALGAAAAGTATGVGLLGATVFEVTRRVSRYREMQEAATETQKELRDAQRTYNQAVAQYGRRSDQARDALQELNEVGARHATQQRALRREANQWGGALGRLSEGLEDLQANFRRTFGGRTSGIVANFGVTVLDVANRALPHLGREAEGTAATVTTAMRDIGRSVTRREFGNFRRILDNTSTVMDDLTLAAGNLGIAIGNIFGSPAATRAARRFAGWLEDITEQFREWSRSDKGRRQIADWLEDAETVGKAVRDAFVDIADAIGRFDDEDVDNLAKAIRALGRATEAAIDGVRLLGRAMGNTNENAETLGDDVEKYLIEPLRKWRREVRRLSKEHGDNAKTLEEWKRNSIRDQKAVGGGYEDLGQRIFKWGRETDRSIERWVNNTGRRFGRWVTETTGDFRQFDRETEATVNEWARGTERRIANFLFDTRTRVSNWEIVQAFREKYENAVEATTEFVERVKDILGEILEFLGMDVAAARTRSDSPARQSAPTGGFGNSPSGQGGATGPRFMGGIYDTNNVRYMAAGGLVDVSGVVTSMATGLSRELSRGAVWQEAVGGISDGLKPRVVYGEGRPGSGPKKEGYVPEDMEPSRALPVLSEMASWFNLKVGAGPEEPHAHLPEGAARALFERAPHSVIQMARGGTVYGVPGGRIGFGYQEYVPGYPYSADSRHKGVDVYAPTGTRIVAEYPGRVTDHPNWSTGLASAHDATGKDGGGMYGLVHGHITPSTSIGGTVRPGQEIGSLVSHYGGAHLHLQTYTTGYPYGSYTHASPPLADPAMVYPRVGGPIPPPGAHGGGGFDVWGAIQALINRIPAPNLGSGPYLSSVSDAAKEWAVHHITEFARKHLPFVGDSAGGDVQAIREAASQGLRYGNRVPATSSNVEKMVILAGKESNYGADTYNESSGATGPWQMMPPTFEAYRVSASDNIRDWMHNAAASSRYQLDRYGGLVTHSPYTSGGLALRPQLASVAEHGPEFFMPLHNPESARQFLKFLESYHSERVTRRSPHRYELPETDYGRSAPPSNAGVLRRLENIEDAIRNGTGFKPGEAERLGDGAARGTVGRIKTDERSQADVESGLTGRRTRRDELLGRRT